MFLRILQNRIYKGKVCRGLLFLLFLKVLNCEFRAVFDKEDILGFRLTAVLALRCELALELKTLLLTVFVTPKGTI